jgi:ubiquitin-like-conjugating enzyme ATG3
MKKFIDRMEAAQPSPPTQGQSGESSEKGAGGKKKWGLGGMVRRVTGSGPGEKEKEVKKEGSDSSDDQAGLQVDFYLVIVSSPLCVTTTGIKLMIQFLKFIASIVPTIEVSWHPSDSGR